MRKYKKLTAILTTAILIALMASSLIVAAAGWHWNWNPNQFAESGAPAYMDASKSAYAAASEYGDLLNEDYAWHDPHANIPERTGFNPGPAPDRPDVLWRTYRGQSIPKVLWGGNNIAGAAEGVINPTIADFTGAPMAMNGEVFAYGDIYPNPGANTTQRDAIINLDPHTGAVNWAHIVNRGPTSTVVVDASFGIASYIFKVDDTHFGTQSGTYGFSMFRTDGTYLWTDGQIMPRATYHRLIVCPAPTYMVLGPLQHQGIPGVYVNYISGWDLSDPDVDKGYGGRSVWNYTCDESGNYPMQAVGDGRLYTGSYGSTTVHALNITTGEKVWTTAVQSAVGYMGCYANGKLYTACQSMYVTCYDGATGEILWHNDEGTANRAFNVWNVIYAYGRIYCHDLGFGRTGATKCFDADTGEMLWASQTLFYIGYYRICVADGKIYGRQSDSSVTTGREPEPTSFACWDAFTGEVLWEIRENIAGPILAYGCLIYVAGAGYGDTGSQLQCLSTAVGKPDDWAMFRGNADTPGFTLDKGPMDISGGPKWTFTTGSGINTQPAVADGKVYLNSNDGYTYCLDAYNGSLIWKHKSDEPLMTKMGSSPAVAGGKVYVGPDDGYFYVLDAEDGTELKKVAMGTYRSVMVSLSQHDIMSSPIISGGRVYVGSKNNGLFYCLNLNGDVQWSIDLDGEGEPIVGSAAVSDGYIYIMDWDNYINKIDMAGNVVLRFEVETSGDSFWSGRWHIASYTPTVVGDKLWVGGTNNRVRCYNVTDGSLIFSGVQPNVRGETAHGSAVYVPDYAINAVYSNGTESDVTQGKIITQAGPTMSCSRADTGENIWSSWGGWEIWSTPLFSGIGMSAVVYYGSDSAGLQVINASDGAALSWYTAGGNIPGSPALWDGKLYIGSYDNKLYCFEDRNTQEMAISISTDKSQMNVGDSITVTLQLTKIPDINVYEEIGRPAKTPGLPDAPVLVTFTKPDGVTEVTRSATTDKLGWASVTFAPDAAGTWKIITWYEGEDNVHSAYGYAFSDEATVDVVGGVEPTPTPTPTPTTGGEIPMEYVWAAVAVVVIVVVVLAVLLFLRRR
jgi:outer membrane protein assembly factor BamB